MLKKNRTQSGQVLLIIILISTVLLTIGLSLSQISVEEGRIAKLEEEKKKAFAAAEAGLDAAIKLNPGQSLEITTLNLPDIQSGTASVSSAQSTKFTTPTISKDEQYTLYMSKYISGVPLPTPAPGDYFNGDLTFYLGSGPSCPVLELTLISNTNVATRNLIDPCDQLPGQSGIATTTTGAPFLFEGTNYSYKTSITFNVTNTKVMLIRTLFADTKVGVDAGSTNLPTQGKTIVSDATTKAGSTEKVELFQSHPQIPANFFVTSF